MAFLGHLGPPRLLRSAARNTRSAVRGPRSVGGLGPFWPNPMRPKGAKGGSHLAPKARWVPNHNWAHLSHFWPPIPWTQNGPKNTLDPFLAINPSGPIFGPGPPWTNFTVMASGNQQRPPNHLNKHFPQLKGNSFLSFMHSVLKIAGVVHIWYYIPLCTIFTQQSNGDVFRTQFHLSISRSIIPTPIFEGGLFSLSVWQSMAVIQKIIQGSQPPVSAGVGLVQFIQDYSKVNSQEVLHHLNQLSRHQVFNTPWTTQFIRTGLIQSTCMALAQLGHFLFHCVNSITQFKFQDGQNCISRFGQYSH